MADSKPIFRVIVRARDSERGRYVYQIFTVGGGAPRPLQSDNIAYATREDAERAGQLAVAILLTATYRWSPDAPDARPLKD
jgi:hypothetical protein